MLLVLTQVQPVHLQMSPLGTRDRGLIPRGMFLELATPVLSSPGTTEKKEEGANSETRKIYPVDRLAVMMNLTLPQGPPASLPQEQNHRGWENKEAWPGTQTG